MNKTILLVCCVLLSCAQEKETKTVPLVEIQPIDVLEENKVTITTDKPGLQIIERMNILRFNDNNVKATIAVEYYPESDVVKNIEAFEQKDSYYELFSKPFSNRSINISPENPKSISEIFTQFSINGYDMSYFSQVGSYQTVKIPLNGINLYLLKVGSDNYAIFVVEIFKDSSEFISTLPLDSSRESIVELLGEAKFYTEDRNSLIYTSMKELMQINILLKETGIEKIQYVFWDGI